MKKFAAIAVVLALFAAPALAERTLQQIDPSWIEVTPAAEYAGQRDLTHIYDNLNTATAALGLPPGAEIGDDLHMLTGTSWTHIHFRYQLSTAGSWTGGQFWLYNNTAADGTFTPTIAGFGMPTLPGSTPSNTAGSWNIKLSLPSAQFLGSTHVWMGFYNNSLPFLGVTPLLQFGGAPTIGMSHNHHYTGYPQVIVNPTAYTGNMQVAMGIPEPATICLLAIGGLVALRRRR